MSTTSAVVTTDENVPPIARLRLWPAILLLTAMFLLRALPHLVDSSSVGITMAGLLGPLALSVVMLAWWTFASRVSGRERWQGLVGLTVLTGLGLFLIHPTLRGMPSVVNVIPSAVAGFGLGFVLLHRQPRRRIIAALILTALGVGYWNLQRSEGITGSFQLQTLWRWQPSAEESYLQELAGQGVRPVTEAQQSDLLVSAWPGFRGQHRDASIPKVTVSEDWQSTPPQRLWQRRIGPGWSSFCMAGNRLFTQEQRGELEAVVCLDADTGETLWDVSYRSRFWEAAAGAGPRATPTITDEGLFALGANGILLCIDPLTGDQLWERDLRQDASREPPDWGFSASPLVTDGLVIVHAGGDSQQGLFAYRTRDGEMQWSVPSGDHTYSSAQIAQFGQTRGVLMLTNAALQFVATASGETIWQHEWPSGNYRALQPLTSEASVLIASTMGAGTRRITVTEDADQNWNIQEDWTSRQMKPDFNDFVRYGNAIYGFDGTIFTSLDWSTGERNWKAGRYGKGQVLLLSESGQLLVTTERGEIVLIQASDLRLEERARFQAIEGKTWNHAILVEDRLFLRNSEQAACYRMPLVAATE